jgi:hypothetical protein
VYGTKIGFHFDGPTSPQYSYHWSKQPFAADSDQAKEITRAIGMFIATNMHPFSVVEKNRVFSAPLESAYELCLLIPISANK